MASFTPPNFQERAALAAKAKQAALDKMRSRVPVDDAKLAERQAAQLAREAAEAKRRDAKREAWDLERAARKARADELRELDQSAPILTDAERKAARDARYARRKKPLA